MKLPFRKFNVLRWHRNIQSRREQRCQQREAKQTLQLWAYLEKIFESGQLSFDYENHRLFITQPMAALMMVHGADGWVQSVHNIYEYTRFLQTQKAWEDYMQREELAAVRKAIKAMDNGQWIMDNDGAKPNSQLSREDIERIKRSRRAEIAITDMEPPKVEPFEFLIIPNSTEAKVEPIAIGHYDPSTGQMEVATWDEVKPLLQTTK